MGLKGILYWELAVKCIFYVNRGYLVKTQSDQEAFIDSIEQKQKITILEFLMKSIDNHL